MRERGTLAEHPTVDLVTCRNGLPVSTSRAILIVGLLSRSESRGTKALSHPLAAPTAKASVSDSESRQSMTDSIKLKPWRERANTIGYINGGTISQAEMLRQILKQLPCNGKTELTWVNRDAKKFTEVCDTLCRDQLSACGLVSRASSGSWSASKFAEEWLDNNDPEFLAQHLHANVKYFGELLSLLDKHDTQAKLLEAAKTSFGLNWKSADQVRRRTGWLRSLGMVELWGQRVVRTAAGDILLSKLHLCSGDEAIGNSDIVESDILKGELAELSLTISESQKSDLPGRRSLIGYIPRGVNSAEQDDENSSLTPSASVRKLVEILADGLTIEDFRDQCGSQLGISKSSFNTMLHSLKHMGLIEQTSYNFFAPNEDAAELVEIGEEKKLVTHLHGRYIFFGEILTQLDTPLTTSALVARAKDSYGYSQASNSEVRLRLGFLQDAGLVDRVDWQRFRVTAAGKAFASLLSLQQPTAPDEISTADASITPEEIEKDELVVGLIRELNRLGRDGNESKPFEAAVGKSFQLLGFNTEHLGGSGQTDVMCLAELAPGDRYRVIVDAKSSGNGTVSETSVNFDVLREHKKKHKADHVVVVGPEFGSRLKNWAVDNDVILLTIDDLTSILERHFKHPISLTELRETLNRVDTFRDELLERYQALERKTHLMGRILALAADEAADEDPVTAGAISMENLVYALRKEFSPRPSSEEIKECLEFLASPIITALEENKGRYKIMDSQRNIALRLRCLGLSATMD